MRGTKREVVRPEPVRYYWFSESFSDSSKQMARLVLATPALLVRDSQGQLVRYEDWRKAHPLTPEQIEANRLSILLWLSVQKTKRAKE